MRGRVLAAALFVELCIIGACGARTGLLSPETEETDEPHRDAGPDARDASTEDAREEEVPDVIEEGLPTCDPEALYVYLVTTETILYRFDPPTNGFTQVGFLACPSIDSPFSMGVNRKGRAFVVYGDGNLFLVDVNDASCQETSFQPDQFGFHTFGMGFAIDDDMMGESLYVAEISFDAPPLGLGTIDTNTLELDFISPFSETFGVAMELTSSDDGQLYGYMLDDSGTGGGHVLRIDKATAEILEDTFLPVGDGASALAFAYWGGDFYIFTAPQGTGTTVTRYRPSDGTVTVVATLNERVVGAGVSTCSPGR